MWPQTPAQKMLGCVGSHNVNKNNPALKFDEKNNPAPKFGEKNNPAPKFGEKNLGDYFFMRDNTRSLLVRCRFGSLSFFSLRVPFSRITLVTSVSSCSYHRLGY